MCSAGHSALGEKTQRSRVQTGSDKYPAVCNESRKVPSSADDILCTLSLLHAGNTVFYRHMCRIGRARRRHPRLGRGAGINPVVAALVISCIATTGVVAPSILPAVYDVALSFALSPLDAVGGRVGVMRCMAQQNDSTSCAAAWSGIHVPQHWRAILTPGELVPWSPSSTQSKPVAQLAWLSALGSRRSGRGIALSVGNRHARSALALIETLYGRLGSHLPVEVFYGGPADLSRDWQRRLVGAHGAAGRVQLRDLHGELRAPAIHAPGWYGKVFAALLSRFAEVIVLDADVVLLRAPEAMLEDALGSFGRPGPYAETGALMWRDRCVFQTLPPERSKLSRLLSLLGVDSPPAGSWPEAGAPSYDATRLAIAQAATCSDVVESGVIALNTALRPELHWALAAAALLSDGLSRPLIGGLSWGDKELWWVGAVAVGAPFSLESHASGLVGRRIPPEELPPEIAAARVPGCPGEEGGGAGGRPTGGAVCASFHGHIIHLRHRALPLQLQLLPGGGAPPALAAEWWNGGAAVRKATEEPFRPGRFETWAVPVERAWELQQQAHAAEDRGGGGGDGLGAEVALTWEGPGLPVWATQCILLVPGCTAWGELDEEQLGAASALAGAHTVTGSGRPWQAGPRAS